MKSEINNRWSVFSAANCRSELMFFSKVSSFGQTPRSVWCTLLRLPKTSPTPTETDSTALDKGGGIWVWSYQLGLFLGLIQPFWSSIQGQSHLDSHTSHHKGSSLGYFGATLGPKVLGWPRIRPPTLRKCENCRMPRGTKGSSGVNRTRRRSRGFASVGSGRSALGTLLTWSSRPSSCPPCCFGPSILSIEVHSSPRFEQCSHGSARLS